MNWLREIGRRIAFLLHRRRLEDDLAAEMRLHQQLRAESLHSHDESRRRFGNETLLREDSRAVWGYSWLDPLSQDLRYAFRALKAHPAFTLTAVLSLALGIGANTAIFTLLNAVLLRSLPVEDPQRLVQVRRGRSSSFTNPIWEQIRDRANDALGRTLTLDRQNFEIIGITPPWFTGLDIDNGYQVAIPLGCETLFHPDRSWLNARSTWWLRILGRLPPGASIQQAQSQIDALAPEINRATLPSDWDPRDQKEYLANTFPLRPASTGFSEARDSYKSALFTLMGVVAIVLLIACANIANLMLARAAARQREISIRLAIGASRPRVIRQLLTESLLISFLGAAAGLFLGTF